LQICFEFITKITLQNIIIKLAESGYARQKHEQRNLFT